MHVPGWVFVKITSFCACGIKKMAPPLLTQKKQKQQAERNIGPPEQLLKQEENK